MTALQMSRSTQTFRPQQPAGSRSYLTYSSASMSFVLRKYARLAGFIEPLTGLPKGIHTDALGNATRYEYDAFGNKVKETAPDGSSCSLQYDAHNNLIQLTDQRGSVTRYEYDEHNRLVRQINPDGGEIAYTYNEAGQVLSVTDPLGHVTAYAYDGVDLIRSTDPNGNVTAYAYDEQHRLVSTTDALGNTTSFTYDERDNLTSVTFADGTGFAYEYDKVGNLISQTDALGNVTRFEYDALRQLVKTTYPDGSEAAGSYDRSGNLIAAVDALGGEASASYDGRGNLLTLTDALGNVTSYTYDLSGNLLSETLANGEETQYTYDSAGRLSAAQTSDGGKYAYAYDAAGSLISYTAPDGGVTRFGYDAMGRLISETDPNGAATRYAYDKAGRLTTRTDADGVSVYAFDPNGNLLTVTDQATGEELFRYEYDALDRLTAVYDSEGLIAAYAYTALGERYEIEDEVHSGGTPFSLRSHHKRLRMVNIPMTDGGGTPFNKTATYRSYVSQANSAVEQAKQSARLAAAEASRAAAYAPGSAAAREALAASRQAQQAYNRAQSNLAALKATTSKSAADRLLSAVRSNANAASQAEVTARVCCDRAAGNKASSVTAPGPTGTGASQSPSVQSTMDWIAACEHQQYAAQNILTQAEFSAFLGMVNSLGRKGLDLLSATSKYNMPIAMLLQGHFPSLAEWNLFEHLLPSKIEDWKEALDESTRGLAPNDVAYAVGELATDTVTLLAAAKAVLQLGASAAAKIGSFLSGLGTVGSVMQADGTLVLAESQIGTLVESAVGVSIQTLALAAIGAIAEGTGIPDDIQQLKEDLEEAENGGSENGGEVKPVDTGDLKVIETRSAETANAEWAERGYTNPPYDPNYEVKIVEAGNEEYVRVYSYKADGSSNQTGGWLMKKSDIEGLSPAEIADKYALPKEPTHMCDVKLPSEYRLECGITNRVDGWGSGGGLQFDSMGRKIPEEFFINEILIGG